jgi:hypothetical protein
MAVSLATGSTSPQSYVADTEAERSTGWPEGSKVFCKDTNKEYYLKGGAFYLLGGGSTITDLYGTITAKYFLASPTAIAGVPSFRAMVEADLPTLSSNFIVQGTADTKLSGAQFLGALTTGIVKNTTTTGILSIATAGTDYSVPSGIEAFTGAKTFGAAGAVGKLIIAGNTSGTTILNAAATAGASTLTLQAIDGTIYSTGGTDVSLADGGTGASLSDPAAHTLMGWDNTDNAICFITIGANLTYTQATHTLSASAAGGGATTALDNLASVAINLTLVSDTDNTDALGTAAISWSDLFLGSGSVITWSTAPSTADVTLTHSADTLTFAGGTIALGTATATGGLTGNVTGNCTGTAATVTGATQASITTCANLVSIGTITTGVWTATDIAPAAGGTGVSNGANNTITFTGNYTLGLTLSNNTAVTLPTTGTLMANVSEDTSPTLGGELDCGAHSIGFTQQTATGDGTTTIDWKIGNKFYFTFGNANETFTFTAPTKPCNLVLVLKQYSTGGKTATWPATVMWPAGTAPTLSIGNNDVDIVTFYWDGTNYFGNSSLDFSVPA